MLNLLNFVCYSIGKQKRFFSQASPFPDFKSLKNYILPKQASSQ